MGNPAFLVVFSGETMGNPAFLVVFSGETMENLHFEWFLVGKLWLLIMVHV